MIDDASFENVLGVKNDHDRRNMLTAVQSFLCDHNNPNFIHNTHIQEKSCLIALDNVIDRTLYEDVRNEMSGHSVEELFINYYSCAPEFLNALGGCYAGKRQSRRDSLKSLIMRNNLTTLFKQSS